MPGHRQGFPTPSGGSHARPERRLPKAFGRPNACGRGTWLPMFHTRLGEASGGARVAAPGGRGGAPRIYRVGGTPPVAPRGAPSRKPWEAVSRDHYQGPLVSEHHPARCRPDLTIITPIHPMSRPIRAHGTGVERPRSSALPPHRRPRAGTIETARRRRRESASARHQRPRRGGDVFCAGGGANPPKNPDLQPQEVGCILPGHPSPKVAGPGPADE